MSIASPSPSTKRRLLLGALLLFVVVSVALPTVYHTLKNWRAQHLIHQSWDAFAIGDAELGNQLLREASQMSPGNLLLQRTAEMYQAWQGDGTALQKISDRVRSGRSDTDELLGFSELISATDRQQELSETLARLPKNLTPGESLRRELIEAAMIAKKGDISGAASFCFSKAALSSPGYAARLNTKGAFYLLDLHHAETTRRAIEILQNVARSGQPSSLAAWRSLANLVLSPPTEVTEVLSHREIEAMATQLPLLHGAASSDRLKVAEMQIRSDPLQTESVLNRLMAESKADPQEMLDLAWWLNARGYFSQVIAFAGDERPRQDTAWLMVLLDAKDSLGQRDDISQLLGSKAAEGLPEAIKYMLLARNAMMRGDQAAAEEDWSNVDGALHLETSATLENLAHFEEHIGALDHARSAYREMTGRDDSKTEGLKGLIRLQSPDTSAESLIPLYEELVQASPQSKDEFEGLTYLKLLAGDDIPKASTDARKLLAEQPDSISRISIAALANLRCGDFHGAAEIYEGKPIDWTTVPEQWRVIRSAVLRASGNVSSAESLAATIDQSKLRPESLLLLKQH